MIRVNLNLVFVRVHSHRAGALGYGYNSEGFRRESRPKMQYYWTWKTAGSLTRRNKIKTVLLTVLAWVMWLAWMGYAIEIGGRR